MRRLLRFLGLSALLASLVVPTRGDVSQAAASCGDWTVIPSPNVGTDQNTLTAVASSQAATWGVGYDANGSPYFQTLVEGWVHGQWSVAPSPNLGLGGFLAAVAPIPNTQNWWSVGFGYIGSTRPTLIEYWTGRAWRVAPSPSVGSQDNLLQGVAASSDKDAWAIGDYANIGSSYLTLIEHWDGTSWTVVPSPSPGTEDFLLAVAALSEEDVWAVGNTRDDVSNNALIEHWDGLSWNVTPSPLPPRGAVGPTLTSISGVSASDVWAVGYYDVIDGGNVLAKTLVEHWDGSNWALVASPNPLPGNNLLNGVSAVWRDSVWVVGSQDNFNGDLRQALIEHWNGVSWHVAPSPIVGRSSWLAGIARTRGLKNIWSVGAFLNDQGTSQTLVEQLC